MRAGALLLGLVLTSWAFQAAHALETDQFYAWTLPLEDATDAINAEVNSGIEDVLARVNARRRPCTCGSVERAIQDHFRFAIIARLELWAMKSSLVGRAPATADDEPRYRRAWIYRGSASLDPIRWMPPSPTIEVAGVRIGTDKLGHFISDGAWAEQWYSRILKDGASDDEAVAKAMRFSVTAERTIWGGSTSGILSLGDLEANYQGLLFYRGLCGGAEPALVVTPDGWRLKRRFDIRDYVSPEWDESWQPNIYTPWRWARVRPVMLGYCELLRDPEVQKLRASYAARDRETPAEAIVHRLVASGKLADPAQFTIEAACGLPPRAAPPGSSR